MGELPRVLLARPMADAGWSERDLLLAMTQMLRNLCAWTVVSGRIPGDSMRDMVEISALQLEEDGASPAAVLALHSVFEGAVNGDWARLHKLVNGHKSSGHKSNGHKASDKRAKRASAKVSRNSTAAVDERHDAAANVFCIKKR